MSLLEITDYGIDPHCHPGRGPHVVMVQWLDAEQNPHGERYDTGELSNAERFFAERTSHLARGGMDAAFRVARFLKEGGEYRCAALFGRNPVAVSEAVKREIVEKIGAHLEMEDWEHDEH